MMKCSPLLAVSCLVLRRQALLVDAFNRPLTPSCHTKLSTLAFDDDSDRDQQDDAFSLDTSSCHSRRRRVIQSAFSITVSSLVTVLQFPQPSNAGPVGAKINAAVTRSDLGIAVRESVVRGAQTMDKMDGQWEQFSDRFGLGAARNQQTAKPAPKVIPEPRPLDVDTANRILELSDQTFVALTGIPQTDVTKQVGAVETKVRPSFERSGVTISKGTAQAFNFDSYTHFKAYGDLISKATTAKSAPRMPFNTFRKNFEQEMGQQLLTLLLPRSDKSAYAIQTNDRRNSQQALQQRLLLVDQVCNELVEKGLVAATERSPVDPEQLSDWSDDLVDLSFNVALDGDITMNAQILLQEQGFRFYPNYAKYMIASLLQSMPQQTVTVDDYYFDTDYNSDPDRFEPKEVMLNIVLESA